MDVITANLSSVWYVVSFLLVIIGVAGSFLPVIPGPLVSWLGLLTLQLATPIPENFYILGITFVLTLVLTIADYVIPYFSSKKYGGSKFGGYGASIGLVVGLFVPFPLAIILCAFIGSFIGEMINKSDPHRAFKAAIGSFIGIMATNILKFLVCLGFLMLMIYQVISFA
ncbi:MAG: DUF456 domain-containing protein [Psychroflexus sp.]|nr:DUF456 domain-containing protein [Psychroflexus sp.]